MRIHADECNVLWRIYLIVGRAQLANRRVVADETESALIRKFIDNSEIAHLLLDKSNVTFLCRLLTE